MTGWDAFIRPDYSYVDFAPGTRVLDVGCGAGEQLRLLRAGGCEPVGVEPSASLVEELRAEGFDARQGFAERLPVGDAEFDGLICKVVIPYTVERAAIAEWRRVLRPRARVKAVYHGAGYYLRYLVEGPSFSERVYATRALANSWWYALSGRRLPGWVGDTLYQSRARLLRYYRDYGFSVEREWESPRYRGRPVFIYHELRASDAPAAPRSPAPERAAGARR